MANPITICLYGVDWMAATSCRRFPPLHRRNAAQLDPGSQDSTTTGSQVWVLGWYVKQRKEHTRCKDQLTLSITGDKHERDQVPDVGVNKVFLSVQMTTTIRPIFTIFLAYRSKEPFSLSWWLPLELALYSVVLDFWFYIYHRGCHELDGLWQYHRTHHLTKHPSPLLSSYADSEQEFLEIALIPLLTYGTLKYVFGLPMVSLKGIV